MPDKKIKAVLFDLGETLLNFGKVKTTSLFLDGAKLSYDFLKDLNQPVVDFKLYCWRSLMSLQLYHFFSKITGNDFDALALLKKIGIKKGVKLNQEQWQHIAWLWYKPLSRFGQTEADIKDTLAALKNSGLKLGIVSNTFVHRSSLEKHLEQLGILDFFSVRLFSYEFNFRKPDPRIFITAADRIGERLPNIMFIGDRLNPDIKPALKLDMTAVLKYAYTNGRKKPPKGTYKIKHLAELPALIEKINA